MVFGIASVPVKYLRGVPNLVSWCEGRYAGADFFDNAGNIMPGNGRQGHIIGIVAAPDLIVQRIDGGGMYAHQNLSRVGDWLGNVGKFERFRAAE